MTQKKEGGGAVVFETVLKLKRVRAGAAVIVYLPTFFKLSALFPFPPVVTQGLQPWGAHVTWVWATSNYMGIRIT